MLLYAVKHRTDLLDYSEAVNEMTLSHNFLSIRLLENL